MRRKDKEVADRDKIEAIINRCIVCRVAMVDNNSPYIVPLNFGFADNTLYFHSALKGRKIDILKKNPEVCFEFDEDVELIPDKEGKACGWGTQFKSVIGFGTASFVIMPGDKKKALNIIMGHYTGKSFEFSDSDVAQMAIIQIDIREMTGKEAHQ